MNSNVVLISKLSGIGHWDTVEIAASDRMIRRGKHTANLTPMQFTIFASLAMTPVTSRVIASEELIDTLWGDDEDGGPDDVGGSLRQQICYMRRKLARLCVAIVCVHTRGYHLIISARPTSSLQRAYPNDNFASFRGTHEASL